MNFLQKLDFLMDKYGLNKRTLSQMSGIPYTTIDGWYKKGYEGLKLTTLRKLNEYFNTALDFWILDDITDPNYGKTSGFRVDYEEMEHIRTYRSLDPFGKETVDIVLKREAARTKQLKEAATHRTPATTRFIQYYQHLASAGTGEIIFEDMPVEQIEIPDIPKYKRVSYAISVNGRSMEPLYYDNDVLLIEPTYQIEAGEIGIFIVGAKAYVKKLGIGELISLNAENIPLTEDAKCMGRVVDKFIRE